MAKVKLSSAINKGLEGLKQTPGLTVTQSIDKRLKKSQEHIKKKRELVQKLKGDSGELYEKYWKNNNPEGKEKILKESPKFRALREISDPYIKKEAYMLLALIEKYWDKDTAIRVYEGCWEKDKFYIYRLSSFFTKENAGPVLGFYFGTRKIKWRPKLGYLNRNAASMKFLPDNVKTTRENWYNATATGVEMTRKVTGWWAVDTGDKSKDKDTIKGGKDFGKALTRVKGDEWLGLYLAKSINGIKKEFSAVKGRPGYNDSGISVEDEKDRVKFLDKIRDEVSRLSPTTIKADLLKWFKKQPKNRWISLDESIIGKMCYIYGGTCGKYKYRMVGERIYAIGIDGAGADPKFGKGSYIEIKDGKLGTWIGGKTPADAEAMLKKELLGNMTPQEIKEELQRERAEHDKDASTESKLAVAKGRLAAILRKHKLTFVKYSNLEANFYDKLKVLLKKDLMKNLKYSEEKASEFAEVKIDQLKKDIEKAIDEKPDILRKAVRENADAALRIVVDAKDKVTVSLRDSKLTKKLRDAAKTAIDKTKSAADIASSKATEIMNGIHKRFGFIGGLISKYIFNIPKMLKEYYESGKGGIMVGLLGTIAGVKVGKELLNLKGIKNLDQLIALAKINGGVLKDNRSIDKDTKLKGVKITIPKGKGIKASKKFEAKGKNPMTIETPKKEKATDKGKGLFGIFGIGGKKEKFTHKDTEIVLGPGTEIPKDTIIPKDAKIEKV